ncbi:MAG: diacylglyceryl transferase [Bacteroidia bacterium]|nr:MAG: diacylglyceryl transferase [Bacteroidia bacterium]
MYPKLSDFLREMFGVDIKLPVQSFGFFVAMGFLSGIWVLVREIKRKEKQGVLQASEKKVRVGEKASFTTLLASGIIGFLIGYKFLDIVMRYDLFAQSPQSFLLSADGSFLGGLLGAAVSVFFTWRDKNKKKLDKPYWSKEKIFPHQLAGNILVVAGIFGLLGAKIFHNLENWDELVAHPWQSLISFDGLSFFGGLIIGGLAVVIYAKKNKIAVIHLADAAALVMPLAYAVGRIGCQVTGDGCWGVYNAAFAENPDLIPQAARELGHVAFFKPPQWLSFLPDWLWAYDYPHNILKEGAAITGCDPMLWDSHCYRLAVPVFPTPLYETSMMLLVFGILFVLRKKIRIPGMLFAVYFILAGIERFFIEKIRVNNVYKISGYEITQAELISVLMVLCGLTAIFFMYKNREKLIARWGDSSTKITK